MTSPTFTTSLAISLLALLTLWSPLLLAEITAAGPYNHALAAPITRAAVGLSAGIAALLCCAIALAQAATVRVFRSGERRRSGTEDAILVAGCLLASSVFVLALAPVNGWGPYAACPRSCAPSVSRLPVA